MDITFFVAFLGNTFGNWATQAFMLLMLLIPIFAMFEVIRVPSKSKFTRRLRFNSLVAVRNWAFLTLTLGTLSYVVKAWQTLTNRIIWTTSSVSLSLTSTNWHNARDHGKTAYTHGAWFPDASLTISDLSSSTRWLIVARDFAEQLTWIGLAAVLFVLCASAYRGKPFKALVVRSLYVYAAMIAVSQTALQYLQGSLSGALVHEVAILAHRNVDVNWPQGGSFNYPGWQFGLAILLVALAQIFKRGESLQRETEGLI